MITFSNIKIEYLPFLKKWRNEQIDILRQTKILTQKDQLEWFKKIKKNKDQKLFAILDNKKFIGYCGLVYIDFRHKRAELSFLVDTNRADSKNIYRNDFLAVLNMLCDYGFKKLDLNKIFVETISYRKNHIEILEEFGFKEEAVLKKQYFKKGKFCDSIIHSIFKK
jgi:RimJ/RimL family protein N-acetyltransferase